MSGAADGQRTGRVALLLGGLGLGGWGAYLLLTTVPGGAYWPILRWGVLGIVVHDGLLAPAAVVLGYLGLRRAPAAVRPAARGLLLGAGTLAVVVAVLLGARAMRQNATILAVAPTTAALVGAGVLVLGAGLAAAYGTWSARTQCHEDPPAG